MAITIAIVMTIVMSKRGVALVSTIGLVAIGVVAVKVVAITLVVVISMTVKTAATTALGRMVLLVRELSVVLVAVKLPLAVLFLTNVVVQSDGLIKQCLIVGGIRHRQRYLQVSLESIEEFILPLSIGVYILGSISG
jgi:hypothetical protein